MNPTVFPVRAREPGGAVSYVDTFSANWGESAHEGIDIFASSGSPVLAVEDGEVRAFDGERSGLGVALFIGRSGERYVYAHLSGREGQFPRRVQAGELLGYVGTTGNAVGKSPHLHFEAREADGVPRNPVPLLSGLRLPVAPLARIPVAPATVRRSEVTSGTLVLLAVLFALSKWGRGA